MYAKLVEKYAYDLGKGQRGREAMMTAGVGAIGNALGFALGGLIVGWFLHRKAVCV